MHTLIRLAFRFVFIMGVLVLVPWKMAAIAVSAMADAWPPVWGKIKEGWNRGS